EVILLHEAKDGIPAFLLLEWLSPERPRHADALAEKLGEGLAALHQRTQANHGLDHDNYIGSLPQHNQEESSWAVFYRDHRIRAQGEIARQRGRLPASREKLLNALLEEIPLIVPDVSPSLLHGDLWGGNYMAGVNDTPVIYDPAVYYGHREVEIAFTELFGGFPKRFYDAYNAIFPLDAGYHKRKALYQLYPLMVHMNLFGGGYASQVDSIMQQYIS
ncbi:MAG TPA: fructosamine kinase family protein, partial [Aggregatilineales bacterium]|nr:fructosamine kinase family protein [Aggregatilineales bacterium]